MSQENRESQCLVGFFSDTLHGDAALREMSQKLKEHGEILAGSNVYKKLPEEIGERPKLYYVVLLQTLESKEDLQRAVSLLKTLKAGFSSGAILLAFDQVVQMVPGSTLPSPAFMEDYPYLHCASEVAGDYEHPIMGKTLNELVKQRRTKDHGLEFHSQGKDLI